jgi:hypothetical protein
MILARVALLRGVLLTLVGLGALCVSAFLWSVIAGWAAIGLSALVMEWAIRSETPSGTIVSKT